MSLQSVVIAQRLGGAFASPAVYPAAIQAAVRLQLPTVTALDPQGLPASAFAGLTRITVSATPPVAPQPGDLWVDIS